MNTKSFFPILLCLCLALSGCSLFQPVSPAVGPMSVLPSKTASMDNPALPDGSAPATRTPRPTATPMPTIVLTPSPTFTATPDPKIYNPSNFGDNRQLDGFVMKVINDASGSGAGQLESYSDEFEYNRAPLSIHNKGQDFDGSFETWLIDNWKYFYRDYWLASPYPNKANPSASDILLQLDMRDTTYPVEFSSARFVGQETYQGLSVYHFSFDTSNMAPSKNGWKVDMAQGDMLVSVDGYIPLYCQVTVTGNILSNPNGSDYLPGKITLTKALSNINQPMKIALPASYPNLAIEPGFPLPSGTELDNLGLYDNLTQYFYSTRASEADFMSFYQNLAPTNGWVVQRIGPLQGNSYNCEVCVILSNGKEKVRIVWNQDFHQTFIMVFNPPELY